MKQLGFRFDVDADLEGNWDSIPIEHSHSRFEHSIGVMLLEGGGAMQRFRTFCVIREVDRGRENPSPVRLPPNRTGGSPAYGPPVDGSTFQRIDCFDALH